MLSPHCCIKEFQENYFATLLKQKTKSNFLFVPKRSCSYILTNLWKQRLQKVATKVKTRNNISYNLIETAWGASPEVMRLSAIFLVNCVADFGSPVWLISANTFT